MRIAVIIILPAILAIGVCILVWGLIEAACLKVVRDKIAVGNASSEGSSDLRIIYFSDLHKEFCLVPVRRILKVIREEYEAAGLDAVVFGGDICNKAKRAPMALPYITAIAELCTELKVPFMAVTGNHDAKMDAEELGAFPFDNMNGCIKYLKSRRDGRYIAFAGVGDTGRHERVWMTPPAPSAGIDYASYILLSHNPDLILHMPSIPFKVDVMISGHIHGGQIRTPLGIEFWLRRDDLPYRGIISGLHDIEGTKVYISKGLGCVLLPIRICARPEVNVIDLYCE